MGQKPSRSTFRQRLDEMVSVLREEIVTGKREVGEYLPSEVALGEQFNLSKNSVRKGLERLVSENLIIKVPRIGNQVARPEQEGRTTIRFGYYKSVIEEAALDELLAEFEKEHPHIRVQLVPLPYDNYGETISEYMERELLDAATVNNNDFQSFLGLGHSDLLEPLGDKPELYPFLSDAFRHGERLLGHPLIFSPVVLCYNRDHFKNSAMAEPDSSWKWNDLIRVAEELTDDNHYGFYYHLLSNNRWPIFMLQSGMKLERNEAGKVRLCRTKLMDGMRVCRDMIARKDILPSYMSESDHDAEELFQQGKVSMIMATYFSLNYLRNSEFEFDVAPLPYLEHATTLLLAIGVMINRKSKCKEAARTFLDFLLSYKAQLLIRQRTLSIPAHKQAAEWTGSDSMNRPSRFFMYREIIPSFRYISELNIKPHQIDVIRNEMKLYWSGMEDEQAVCSRLEQLLSE